MTGIELPAWLVAELPAVKPHGSADAAGRFGVVYTAPDGRTTAFPDVVSAYESLREVGLEFGEELVRREGARTGMITFPSERQGFLTAWIPHNDTRDLARLVADYRESLEWSKRYRQDGGDDFLSAFRYVDTHPAFWVRRGGGVGERARWFWETSGHMNRVDLIVTSGEDDSEPEGRSVLIELETGMHTLDMTEHFHDPYLDATGPTFEDAVLMLARNVALSFNDDGTETGSRPSNPWADEWIATIKARIDNVGSVEDAF